MLAIAIGILSATALLIVFMRLGIKKFMGYPALMDLIVVFMLIGMLHGTYTGMVAAVIGGLFFSGMITVIRKLYGYSVLERHGLKYGWVDHKPDWYNSTRERLNHAYNKFTVGDY